MIHSFTSQINKSHVTQPYGRKKIIVVEHDQIWKSLCTFFAGTNYSRDHDVMSEKDSLSKPIKFGIDGKRMSCLSIFAIEPIADFCPFMDYWRSKNVSRDPSIKCEFVSLPKPILLCTNRERILCWSIFAMESIANFCPFGGCWTSNNGSRDHDAIRNLILMQRLWYLVPLGR